MSGTNAAASPQATSPARAQQIKRSLSEFASPGRSSRTRKDRTSAAAGSNNGNGGGHGSNAGISHLHQASAAADARMSSLDIPRGNGFSPIMSPDQSRRGSMLLPPPAKDRDEGQRGSSTESSDVRLRHNQARIAGNTETLAQSLLELNDFSARASRQLDDAYYAVLEKMSLLHATIASLTSLAETSHAMHDSFERDSRGLENQIATRLGAMGHFQNHQIKVATLQKRIHEGRAKVRALGDRVDAVRQRIERWERADRQWQERTRKRIKIIWSVTSVAVLVLVVMLWTVSSGLSADDEDPRAAARGAATDELGRTISILEPLNASDFRQPPGPDGTEAQTRIIWKKPVHEADRLRVFDEL